MEMAREAMDKILLKNINNREEIKEISPRKLFTIADLRVKMKMKKANTNGSNASKEITLKYHRSIKQKDKMIKEIALVILLKSMLR